MRHFIQNLPKAELHVHIEGTLEPEQLLHFAERNKVCIPYDGVSDIKDYYASLKNYRSFLDAYLIGTAVLCTEKDFFELALAYISKISKQGVLHAEIFFDTQTYISRRISSATVINGLHAGLIEGEKIYGVSSFLILCFLRNFSQKSAFLAFQEALPYKKYIKAVGLASTELGNPPKKFRRVFQLARKEGLRIVAHAGEHAGSEYIWEAIKILRAERIDHGIYCLEDPLLVNYLREQRIGLTVCPVSNKALGVVSSLEMHPLRKMIQENLLVSINSDDPVFFGRYIADVIEDVYHYLCLSKQEVVQCARNSFLTSFLSEKKKEAYIKSLEEYVQNYDKVNP